MRSFLDKFTPVERKIFGMALVVMLAVTSFIARGSSSPPRPSKDNFHIRSTCETSVVQTISESDKLTFPEMGASSVNASSTVKKILRSTITQE